VVLDLEVGRGPLSGKLVVDRGPPRRFSGWLELIDLVERARRRGDEDPSPARRRWRAKPRG